MKPFLLPLAPLLVASLSAEVEVSLLTVSEHRTRTVAKAPGERDFGGGQVGSLTLELMLSGPEVEAATHLGPVKLDAAEDDGGKSLVRKAGGHFGDGFDEIDREHMWFMSDDPPKDRIKVRVDLDPAGRQAAKLTEVAGVLTLRTTESKPVLLVPEAGKAVSDPLLSGAGVKVRVKKVDAAKGSLELAVEDPDGKLGKLDWVDAEGESLVVGTSSFGFNNKRTVSLDTGGKSAEGARLRIPVYTKVSNEEVRFKLENIELP